MYFTDEVWDLLVTETNRYSKLGLPQQKFARPWHDVTVEDMKAFVGLLIIMGVLQLPQLEMYWQTDSNLLQTPGVSSVMSQIQFEQIWRFLHLADNLQDDKTDKLFKVRHFVDLITAQFSDNYTLHQPVTIDEAMIPYKGRLSFKQYMKSKPTKWGIKVFVLSDATNGYIYRIQIYTGTGLESNVDVGLCSRVLLELMTGLDGHHLYTDNYHTSPEVYLELYKKGINCCGTVRTNRRGFPKELIKQDKPAQQKQHAIAESALTQNNYRHYINSMSPRISEIIQLGRPLMNAVGHFMGCLDTKHTRLSIKHYRVDVRFVA